MNEVTTTCSFSVGGGSGLDVNDSFITKHKSYFLKSGNKICSFKNWIENYLLKKKKNFLVRLNNHISRFFEVRAKLILNAGKTNNKRMIKKKNAAFAATWINLKRQNQACNQSLLTVWRYQFDENILQSCLVFCFFFYTTLYLWQKNCFF